MFKKLSLAGAALAMTAGAIVPAAAADAHRTGYRHSHNRYADNYGQDRDYRRYNSYRAQQKCADGDGGTIVGAIAGGLLGRTIDTRGSRLLGTVLGAGAGALAGRAIDRSDRPGYCR